MNKIFEDLCNTIKQELNTQSDAVTVIKALAKSGFLKEEVVKAVEEESAELTPSLTDLAGYHIFTGVELGYEHGVNTIRFELDGKVYEAWEDPDDGYRSYMSDLKVSNYRMKNKVPPMKVKCRHLDVNYSSSWSSSRCDLLQFIDLANDEVFLTIGTDDIDDYYPGCIFEYKPELMEINRSR